MTKAYHARFVEEELANGGRVKLTSDRDFGGSKKRFVYWGWFFWCLWCHTRTLKRMDAQKTQLTVVI